MVFRIVAFQGSHQVDDLLVSKESIDQSRTAFFRMKTKGP